MPHSVMKNNRNIIEWVPHTGEQTSACAVDFGAGSLYEWTNIELAVKLCVV